MSSKRNRTRKRKAIYLRVSREENESIDLHESMLKELCGKEGIALSEVDIFKEEALSGANLDRPQLNALLANLKEYDTVIVKDIDRLSRDDSQAFDNKHLFWINDVEILTPSRRYNFDNEADEMMYGLESMFAKMELRKIKQRFKDGKVNKAKAGKWIAGGAPIGYMRNAEGFLAINPEEATIVLLCYEMSAMGYGGRRIRQTLLDKGLIGKDKKFTLHANSIRVLIRSRVYLGEVHFTSYDSRGEVLEEIHVQDAHAPLVSLELWTRANAEIERRTKNNLHHKGELLAYLQTLLKCSSCGSTIRPSKYRVDHSVISFRKCDNQDCEHKQAGAKASFVEELFESELFKFRDHLSKALSAVEVDNTKKLDEELDKELVEVEKELQKLQNRKENIKELFIDGDIDKVEKNSRLKKVGKEEQTLLDRKKLLLERQEHNSTKLNLEKLLQLIEDIDNFYSLTLEQKRDLALSLVDKIVYSREVPEGTQAGRGQAEEWFRKYPARLEIHWRTDFI